MDFAVKEGCESAAASRLRAAGGSDEDLLKVARATAFSLTFGLCYLIDSNDAVGEDGVDWRLMEIGPNEEPTGRDLGGLHESLTELDPTGNEASNWHS